MKEYIGYPQEILEDWRLEELYEGLHVHPDQYFKNGISVSKWGTNYAWGKLRYLAFCKLLLYSMFTYSEFH